jgi:signal peptidase II
LKPAVPLSRYLVFLSIAVSVCALDLATKSWVFSKSELYGPAGRTWWILKGVFGFQASLNEGALFGFGHGLWPLFAGLSVGAAVGIVVWLFLARAAHDWLLTVALGLVVAGILGNLYDRAGLPGLTWQVWNDSTGSHQIGETVHAVRDFILVMIGRWPWPNFNLADSSLVCGAGVLMWHAVFAKVEPAAKT